MSEITTLYTYLRAQADQGENMAFDGLLLVLDPVCEIAGGDALVQAQDAGLIEQTNTGFSPTDLGRRVYAHHQQLQLRHHRALR